MAKPITPKSVTFNNLLEYLKALLVFQLTKIDDCYQVLLLAGVLSYLDKNFTVIRRHMDFVPIFAKLSSGQQNNLTRVLRNFLNFSELKGSDPTYLNTLRKAIPQDITGCDLKVPFEAKF